MAFCEGLAILGVVAGILAIYTGGPVAVSDEVLAAALPIAGAVLGLVLVARDRATTDPLVAIQATSFIIGLGVLGPVVAFLGSMSASNRVITGNFAPYLILGLTQLLAILGIALTSAGSIRSMRGADIVATRAILSRQIVRSATFELVGVGSVVIAIWLVVTGAGPAGAPA
jgi:hypothetical protein